ncbi:MAG TPA: hypothetical protein VMU58_03595, partial [Gaiellaceae bacterium]|nr:hypothetical protein [Gaiellaceae bacterium]
MRADTVGLDLCSRHDVAGFILRRRLPRRCNTGSLCLDKRAPSGRDPLALDSRSGEPLRGFGPAAVTHTRCIRLQLLECGKHGCQLGLEVFRGHRGHAGGAPKPLEQDAEPRHETSFAIAAAATESLARDAARGIRAAP